MVWQMLAVTCARRLASRAVGGVRRSSLQPLALQRAHALSTAASKVTASMSADGWRAHVDWRWFKANTAALQDSIRARGMTAVDGVPARAAALHTEWLALDRQLQEAEKQRHAAAKRFHTAQPAPGSAEHKALSDAANAASASAHALQQRHSALWDELYAAVERVPNLISPQTPEGDESKAKTLHVGGTKPAFSFAPRDHMALGREAQWFNVSSAVAGPRFLTLQNEAALLELALINFAVSRLVARGFGLLLPPDIVKAHYINAAGFQPRAVEHSQIYHIRGDHQPSAPVATAATAAVSTASTTAAADATAAGAGHTAHAAAAGAGSYDLALTGTAEVPIAALWADRTVAHTELPIRVAAFGHCFRTEIGRGAAESAGIYRLHQFSKVEMFQFTAAHDSARALDELVAAQRELLDALELHYRVLEMPTQELGAPAYRKIDVEAWMPSRNAYGEVSSASNCTDYQSRRLNIKFSGPAPAAAAGAKGGGKPKATKEFVHTLNATACAVPRLIIALLEQHQRADGTVHIPAVLRPFLLNHTALPFLTSQQRVRTL